MTLSRVCARWRRITVDSHRLWSHIDYSLDGLDWRDFVVRAEIYADRAGNVPLHLKLTLWEYALEWDEVFTRAEKFFGLIAARIEHLEVLTTAFTSGSDPLYKFQSRIISVLLTACIPGVLTKITFGNWHDLYFVSSPETSWSDDDWQLSIPYHCLEKIWEPITILQVDGLVPYWTSKAYHNLVELRIHAVGDISIELPESQLVDILKASPRLRAIHLDISLPETSPSAFSIMPVLLESLEVLSVVSGDHERIIQWFAPGSEFLKLSIGGNQPTADFIVGEAIIELLKKSKKAGLHLTRVHIAPKDIAKALCRMPGLRALALTDCVVWHNSGHGSRSPSLESYRSTTQPSCLLYLLDCEIDYGGPQWISEQNLAKRVILAECCFSFGPKDRYPTPQDQARERFSSCPGIELLGRGETIRFSPAWDWPDQGIEPGGEEP